MFFSPPGIKKKMLKNFIDKSMNKLTKYGQFLTHSLPITRYRVMHVLAPMDNHAILCERHYQLSDEIE